MKRFTKILVINNVKTVNIISSLEIGYDTPAWLAHLKIEITEKNADVDLVSTLAGITDARKRFHASVAVCKFLKKLGIPYVKEIAELTSYNIKGDANINGNTIDNKATKRN